MMTDTFYDISLNEFNDDIDLVTSNGFRVKEDLVLDSIMIHPDFDFDYSKPIEAFKFWFGINDKNEVTKSDNNFSQFLFANIL